MAWAAKMAINGRFSRAS